MFATSEAGVRRNSTPPAWLIVAGMAVVAVPGLLHGFQTGGTQDPRWKAVWVGDFAGRAGGGVDTRVWKFDTGHGVFGTQEIETMTADSTPTA
jgi:hypothetical protein